MTYWNRHVFSGATFHPTFYLLSSNSSLTWWIKAKWGSSISSILEFIRCSFLVTSPITQWPWGPFAWSPFASHFEFYSDALFYSLNIGVGIRSFLHDSSDSIFIYFAIAIYASFTAHSGFFGVRETFFFLWLHSSRLLIPFSLRKQLHNCGENGSTTCLISLGSTIYCFSHHRHVIWFILIYHLPHFWGE